MSATGPARAPIDVDARPAVGAVCPCCGADGLEAFHEQEGVPVHSVRLVPTRAEALDFPRGALRLGLCRRCGFITNTAYDPALQDYAVAYEETQGCSPTFNSWASGLARRWVERYDLEGDDVLEIGAGKGEFLASMIEHGAGHGVGIDPSFEAGRLDGRAGERIDFIADYYSERYAHLAGDAVVCRHTLEHIHPAGDFVRLVRGSLAGRPDAVVLLELPDAMRVLREVAFWDVYYEHCSYFTPGSLARLLRSAGFELLELELDYGDQYILAECRPAHGAPAPPHRLEEEPAEVADAAARFADGLATTRARWRERLERLRADGGRAAIWGGGSKGVSFLTTVGLGDEIAYVVDVNPRKQGMYMAGSGHRVVGPGYVADDPPDLMIAMNPIYLEEIGAELAAQGVDAELVAA